MSWRWNRTSGWFASEDARLPPDASPFDLDELLGAAGVEDHHFIEIQVVLQSLDRSTSPTLQEVEVQWGCPIIIG